MQIPNHHSVNAVYGVMCFMLVCIVTKPLSLANHCGGTTPLGERVYVGCMV